MGQYDYTADIGDSLEMYVNEIEDKLFGRLDITPDEPASYEAVFHTLDGNSLSIAVQVRATE